MSPVREQASGGLGAGVPVPAAPLEAAAPGEAAPPGTAWRFQAAAPSSGAAAVAEDGAVYVSTVEGYVHALGRDGAYRWSYGLSGVPIGAPAVDRSGHVFVATSAQRLYALRGDGRLGWVHRSPVRIASDVVWSAPGVLFFAGHDQRLYSLAAWGSQLWSRHLLGSVAAAPSTLGAGWVAVGTEAPAIWFFRNSAFVTKLALPGALRQPLESGAEHWFAVAGAEVLAFTADRDMRVAWRRPGRHAGLSPDAAWLVVENARELVWLSPRTGQELHRVALPDDPSAPPSVTRAGVALVPLVSGDLFIADAAGARTARVPVAPAPLRAPVWSERSQHVVVVAGNGVVVAIDLQGWSPSEPGARVDDRERPADGADLRRPASPLPPRGPGATRGGGA